MTEPTIRAHVFTDADANFFLKQFAGFIPELDGVRFSFGMEIPQSGIDALIVFNRASYTLPTNLPKARTAFIAAEPDVIHPYKLAYLNQYGLVVSVGETRPATEHWHTATCWYWFAGLDFANLVSREHMRGRDFFDAMTAPPAKQDKISVVTSNKSYTDYHRKRIAFLDALKNLIPDHLEIFGRGYRRVDDKADALLPYKYHIAVENGAGRDAWTEKLADPLLCWALPFYAGCDNVEDYIPSGSFRYIDLDNPKGAAKAMVKALESGEWEHNRNALETARRAILDRYNLAHLLVRIAKALHKAPTPPATRPRHIWSERSFLPQKGTRGNIADFALVNAVLAVDPKFELRSHSIRRKLEAHRSERRRRKLDALEKKR